MTGDIWAGRIGVFERLKLSITVDKVMETSQSRCLLKIHRSHYHDTVSRRNRDGSENHGLALDNVEMSVNEPEINADRGSVSAEESAEVVEVFLMGSKGIRNVNDVRQSVIRCG